MYSNDDVLNCYAYNPKMGEEGLMKVNSLEVSYCGRFPWRSIRIAQGLTGYRVGHILFMVIGISGDRPIGGRIRHLDQMLYGSEE